MHFVHRATEQNLPDLLGRARFGLVSVALDEDEPFMRGLDVYFRATYPASFVFAKMRPGYSPNLAFWRQHFGTESTRYGRAADGVYLFERGALIGCKPKLATVFRPYYGDEYPDEEAELLRERRERERVQSVVGRSRLSPVELKTLCGAIADIEPLVQVRVAADPSGDTQRGEPESSGRPHHADPSGQAAGSKSGSRKKESGSRKRSSSERGTTASDGAPPEHYAVLGIDPGASDAAVRAAWLEQLKLNHPDKVAHLSAAIRRVALDQTLAIQRAYDAIQALRRN